VAWIREETSYERTGLTLDEETELLKVWHGSAD
jgi:hypothetical protein